MLVESVYILNILYSYFRITFNFMSKEDRSERGKQAAAKEKFVAKMKEMPSISAEDRMGSNRLKQ